MTPIENYIMTFPSDVQVHLTKLHALIKMVAKDAEESISYGMPAYKVNGKPLIYFAGYKKHIGLYATPSAHQKFAKEMAHYKQGKGSVQFQLNEPIPFDFIERIVHYKLEEIKTSTE